MSDPIISIVKNEVNQHKGAESVTLGDIKCFSLMLFNLCRRRSSKHTI